MTGAPRTPLLDRSRTPIGRAPARAVRRAVTVLLLMLGIVALIASAVVTVHDASAPRAGEVAVLSDGAGHLGVEYVDAPALEFVDYRHGAEVSYAVELWNDGPVAVTIEDVPLQPVIDGRRLIRPTGVLLAPVDASPDGAIRGARAFEPFRLDRGASRTVIVQGVFDNCTYYTERAMDLVASQPVTWSLAGWSTTTEVELSRQLAVRSPYLRACPGRVMDRSAATRTGAL